jgi:hypothetical protein
VIQHIHPDTQIFPSTLQGPESSYYTTWLIRPHDMLHPHCRRRPQSHPPVLERTNPDLPADIIVTFALPNSADASCSQTADPVDDQNENHVPGEEAPSHPP